MQETRATGEPPKPQGEPEWTWFPFVWAVVVDRDPEMADMDNPHGERISDRHFPCAENARGNRYVSWQNGFGDHFECEALCSLYNDHHVLPNPKRDSVEQPAYGSRAYIREGWEADNAERERQDDLDGWPQA